MYIHNKYFDLYNKIINNAKNRTLPTGTKVEVHHILPRSLGGTNLKENLVKLTLKEHWVCHRLLVKFLSKEKHIRKMYNALYIMSCKDYRTVNARIYEHIKLNIIPWNKGLVGIKGHPCAEELKESMRKLHIGKKRNISHIEAMKKGWDKLKRKGYTPWNKGITGIVKFDNPITLISPTGERKPYRTLREGCDDNDLIYTKMSAINARGSGQNNGWTILGANENFYSRDELVMFSENKITCHYCDTQLTNVGLYLRWHGNNCKLKP
jgi:hypothetical protein